MDITSRQKAIEYIRNYNERLQLDSGIQPLAYTHSFGCQQNVADGETLEGILLEMGYTFSENPENADVVLYNTCAVRENAENTVFGAIGNLKSIKAVNTNMIIGICGCMTQQKHISNQIKTSYPHVDLVFGAGAMDKLPELIMEKLVKGGRVFRVDNPTSDIIENLPTRRENNVKVFVPIMSGCNNFCTYCVVPYVRGRERSRKPEKIISEITDLVNKGFKEITLLGQNVNSYGKNLDEKINFTQLLEKIANIPGKFRIRFVTAHPKDCTSELLDVISRYDNITKHLHLPVQSGSNRILELMNRGYTAEHYLSLVRYAQKTMPKIAITSDIIVGFPGENDIDFGETIDLVEKVGYSALFTFAYSSREGTKAAEMENNITQSEKTERFEKLLSLQRKKSNEFNQRYVGEIVEVLAEESHKSKIDFLIGRTDNNILVIFKAPKSFIGEFVNVKITNFMDWAVEGEIQ